MKIIDSSCCSQLNDSKQFNMNLEMGKHLVNSSFNIHSIEDINESKGERKLNLHQTFGGISIDKTRQTNISALSISKSDKKDGLEDTLEKKNLDELIQYSMHLMDMSKSTANHQASINEQMMFGSEKQPQFTVAKFNPKHNVKIETVTKQPIQQMMTTRNEKKSSLNFKSLSFNTKVDDVSIKKKKP